MLQVNELEMKLSFTNELYQKEKIDKENASVVLNRLISQLSFDKNYMSGQYVKTPSLLF